mmetsp:Transcript_5919/g.17585  ORF Transcript_5919/g.17585 Transcript_5919/m.17585 type:complete len:264 (+) Transcript_5919:684-1475(+)
MAVSLRREPLGERAAHVDELDAAVAREDGVGEDGVAVDVPGVLAAPRGLVSLEEVEDALGRRLRPHARGGEGVVESAVLAEALRHLAGVVGAHLVHVHAVLAALCGGLVVVERAHRVEQQPQAPHGEREVDEHVREGDAHDPRLDDGHGVNLRAVHDLHEGGEVGGEGRGDVSVVVGLAREHLAAARLDDVLVADESDLVEGPRANAALDGAHLVRRVPADVVGEGARARVERHRVDVKVRRGLAEVHLVVGDAVLLEGLHHP